MNAIMLVLAIAPGAILFAFCCDRRDFKRSARDLLKLALWGAAVAVVAGIASLALESCLVERITGAGLTYDLIKNFVIAGLLEELCKFAVLRWKTWKGDRANDELDAIRCAVAIALGFATLENILYFMFVLDGSAVSMVLRTLFSVPGHAADGVLMGLFYGRAKRASADGQALPCLLCTVLAVLVPTLHHGMYDFLCMTGNGLLGLALQLACGVVALLCVLRLRTRRGAQPVEGKS